MSSDILHAALAGLEAQKQAIEHHIKQVRAMLGILSDGQKGVGRPPKSAATISATSTLTASTESAAPASPARKRRRFSAETRAEAQRKRYAAANKATEAAPAKPATKKRKLSAAGRKRIIEATKKRWAAYKAKKAAS